MRLVDEETESDIEPAKTVWASVRLIVVADAVMSLDNVMAIAAVAKGSVLLIAFGLVLSIPLVVFGSALLLSLINRFPALVWAGAALLGWIAGALVADDPDFAAFLGAHGATLEPWAAPAGAGLVLAAAWLRRGLKRRA